MTHKELVKEIVGDIRELYGKIKTVKTLGPKSVGVAIDIIEDVTIAIEEHSDEFETLSGSAKKKLAIDIINELIDIPVLPEIMEAKIIGFIVDTVIRLKNKWLGKGWN